MDDEFELIRGSGNVYQDFGRPNTGLKQARAIVGAKIIQIMDDRRLYTKDAEQLTGVSHTEFSRLRNAKLSRVTLDRLITILGKFDQSVEINISFHPSVTQSTSVYQQPNLIG
jgi:predicted XRE-type DNA-binding protein